MLTTNSYRLIFMFLISFVTSSCTEGPKSQQIENSERSEIELLRTRIDSLELEVNELIVNSVGSTKLLSPGDDGYSVIQGTFGPLTVQISDVKPYADGSKVTFSFGNPHSASLLQTSARISWGDGFASSKTLNIVKPLAAGSWTTTTAVLEGTPPDKLRYIKIDAVTNKSISLRK